MEIKNHQTYDIAVYQNGKYTVPALGGVIPYPQVKLLVKDTGNKDIHYAIVDYMLDSPQEGTKRQYEYLIKLQKNNGYILKAVKEVASPIDFELFNQVIPINE